VGGSSHLRAPRFTTLYYYARMAAQAVVMINRRRKSDDVHHTGGGGGGAGGHHGSSNQAALVNTIQSHSPEDARRFRVNEAKAGQLRDSNFRSSKVFDLSDLEGKRQHAASRIQLFARAHCIPSYGKRLHRSNLFTRLQYEGTLAFGAWRLFIQVPMRVLCLNLPCLCRGSWFFCPENTRR